jgi:hypothetical protein
MHLFRARMRTIPQGVQDSTIQDYGRISVECGCRQRKAMDEAFVLKRCGHEGNEK